MQHPRHHRARKLERQTEEQAEELADLHRRKDEFLAMLSHELRNPLAPILNAMHLLRLQTPQNRIQQQAQSIVERQVGQLAHLVDDLLEVSRITSGKILLQLERVDLRKIVEHAVDTAHPLIDQRKHQLSLSLPPEPVWVHSDPTRMEQVVVNLLNNAAKYTDVKGHITLSVQQQDDEVVLRVKDTGVGIAPQLLPHIFDIFTQAERTLARSQGGLGIGLSVVRKLVEMHQGTVEVHSAGLEQGSEFIVRLPGSLSQTQAEPKPKATAGPNTRAYRVLVVDDNVDSADSTAMLMRFAGHEARVAYSGETALATAVEFQPKFVLLDIGLPDIEAMRLPGVFVNTLN